MRHRNSFVHLRCHTRKYMLVRRDASYLGKSMCKKSTVKCESSRFLEVDSGDGQKRQLAIPVKILWYLPFIPRIQRLYMTEESMKQMTWHKNGRRYNPEKLVHPSDGEA